MPEANSKTLDQFVPIEALDEVNRYINAYQLQLWVKSKRFGKLGDFRPQNNGRAARICINGNLNVYSFLLVFLHEIAHVIVFKQFGNSLSAHGKLWKDTFGYLLRDFAHKGYFHYSLTEAILSYSYRVKASGIGCPKLQRLLYAFDNHHPKEAREAFLEDLPETSLFLTKTGRLFRKEKKMRTRYRCFSVDNRRYYLFHPMTLVLKYYISDQAETFDKVYATPIN
ncbi:MAG TPA: hypothetical protein VLH61_06535 [Bacteroidales bacterium]|nr:hypothetical protein [Bacteroidales bacterium]